VIPVQLDVVKDQSVVAVAERYGVSRATRRYDEQCRRACRRIAFEIASTEVRIPMTAKVFGVVRMIHAMVSLLRVFKQPSHYQCRQYYRFANGYDGYRGRTCPPYKRLPT